MEPKSRYIRLLSGLLRSMAACDPYCYGYLASLEAEIGAAPPRVGATKGSALFRISWGFRPQP